MYKNGNVSLMLPLVIGIVLAVGGIWYFVTNRQPAQRPIPLATANRIPPGNSISTSNSSTPTLTTNTPMANTSNQTWQTYSNAKYGFTMRYPAFSAQDQIVTSTRNGGFIVDFQTPGPDGMGSKFSLGISPNSSSSSLQDWFENTIDRGGVLLASGAFVQKKLSNDLLVMSDNTGLQPPLSFTTTVGPIQVDDIFMAPGGRYVFTFVVGSQDLDLGPYGYKNPADYSSLAEQIVSMFHFTSASVSIASSTLPNKRS